MIRKLNNENIGEAIREMNDYFQANGADHAFALRMTLAAEEILLTYQDKFGEETLFSLETGGLFRGRHCELRVMCEEYDPAGEGTEDQILRQFMSQNALVPRWSYVRHSNRILCSFNKKTKLSGGAWLLIAIVAAILLGLIAKTSPEGLLARISDSVVFPLSSAIMRVMRFFAAFVIFWNIILAIGGMGNLSTFNLVGKRTISRFMLTLSLFTFCTVVSFLPQTPLSDSGNQTFTVKPMVTMLLDIIPSDPFTPFITGNTLQVLFIAFLMGIVLLVLKERLGLTLFNGIQDLSEVSNCILSAIVKLVPVVVFFSLFEMIVDNDLSQIVIFLEYPVRVAVFSLTSFCILFLIVCVTRKVSPAVYFKKILPVIQIALVTASSTAAYLETVEVCEKKLGIDERLVKIGVPIGPSLLGVSRTILFVIIAFMAVKWYQMPVSFTTIITIFLSSYLLSISVPPIPGGLNSVYLVFFSVLGLPEEMLAIVLAFSPLLDHIMTAVDQGMVTMELTQTGASLNMLDEQQLRKA